MDVNTSKITMLVANDIGASLEDKLDGERKAQHELSGAAHALKQAAKKVPQDLAAHVDRALNDGEIEDGLTAPLIAQLIKKYLTRVGDFLEHLGDIEVQKAVAQGGRVAGIELAMSTVKKLRDDEVAKIQKLLELSKLSEETGEVVRTPSEAARAARGSVADRRVVAQLDRKSVDAMTEEELEQYLMQEST
jgi:hypothetical protein